MSALETDSRAAADRLLQQLGGHGAMICTDQANVRFVLGTANHADTVYGDTPFWAIIAPGGVRVVSGAADVPEAAAQLGLDKVEGYGRIVVHGDDRLAASAATGRSLEEAAAAALRSLGVTGSAVMDAVPSSGLGGLRSATELEIVVDGSPFDLARAVKDTRAIATLERVNRVVEAAIAGALATVADGMTEDELGVAIRTGIAARGAWPTLCVVGFGERGAIPEAWPSAREIASGELIRLDVGATLDGYHADLARTAVLGEPDTWARTTYDALHAGQDVLLEAARPGATAAEVFAAGLAATREAGLAHYARHHLGHGIGLSVYETLIVGPHDETVLREGMTLCLETPYYEIGVGGIQLEDAVVIEPSGARRLGTLERRLLRAGP